MVNKLKVFLFAEGTPPVTAQMGHSRMEPGTCIPGIAGAASYGARNPPEYRGVLVAACDVIVDVSELQPAGGKRMTAAEFLRGYPLVEGARFGPETL